MLLKDIVACSAILLLFQVVLAPNFLLFAHASSISTVPTSYENTLSTDSNQPPQRVDIVSFSIIIDEANDFDQLADWLEVLNFRNFTFVIVEDVTNVYILENATRLGILKQYGEIIPRLPYLQGYDPAYRVLYANFTLNEFVSAIGYSPKGVMDFIPDTYTSQYLLNRGVEYYQGYCFDQYNIDRISSRGGFQMPYYSNSSNILCPNFDAGGIVVLPHSTWDWTASFTVSHNLQLHPLNLMNMKYSGNQTAKNYFLNLVDATLAGSSPFGYATIQFEWSWLLRDGDEWQVLDWLQTLIHSRTTYQYLTFGDAVSWFKANYNQTPTYRIDFTSPYDGTRIEWFYSLTSRVARIGNNVISYVDYSNQQPDRYLTTHSPIVWDSPASSTNSIDNSLSFKVDALGGGYLRAPISTASVSYNGDLEDFAAYYSQMKSASSQTQLMVTVSFILIAAAALAGVFVTHKRKRLLSNDRT